MKALHYKFPQGADMRRIILLKTLLAIALLVGCSDDFQDDEVLAVSDFYVIGTNNNDRDETPVIDPYESAGIFDIFAKISKPDLGYYLNLYVGGQESLRDATQLYALECTNDDEFCYDPDYYAIGCVLEPDMTGNCLGQTFDLTNQFSRLPFSGYAIIEVCHRVQNRCVVQSERALFR